MLELLTGGLITIPMGFLSWSTAGYIDASSLVQLQALQTVTTSMVAGSISGALSPERLIYSEDAGAFIYVSEMLGA